MKYIFLIFIFTIHLFALDIYLNSAKEDNFPYAVLHIIDDKPIVCSTIHLPLDKKNYICKFKKIVKNRINEKKLRLVNIDFIEKKDAFYIKVIPKFDSQMIAVNDILYNTKDVDIPKITKKSKHWTILIYKKYPFGKKGDIDGINFPVTYDKYLRPIVGPVDLNGAPIAYAKSQDINYYLDIQDEFNNRDFIGVVKDVDRTLKQYPRSIFKSDLLLYKLKAIDESIEKNISPISDQYTNKDVAKLAKSWMREFPSNENIAEVLFILVKDYLRADSGTDVNYFLDILVTEHKDSPYTKRAILYYADSLYKKNNKNKAVKLYENVLYSAKDMDIASIAAIRLANSKINSGNAQEAKQYLLKVLKANKKYLLEDKDATARLAVKLASNGLQGIAARMNDLLLKHISAGEIDSKELLLKRAGDWYLASGNTAKAYARYIQYKKEYKDGIYIDEVNKALDRLFFKIKETNETKLAKYYDVLISKYNNDIKDKAIIAKAKLFLKHGKYQKIIDMKKMLLEADDKNSTIAKTLIKKSAIMLIDRSLKNKECEKAVQLIESNSIDYNKIKNSKNLFKCFLITARYKKAGMLASYKIHSKKLEEKFNWLENSVKVYAKMQKFDEIIALKDDIFSLSKLIKKQVSYSTYRALFDAYYYKKKYDKSLNVAKKINAYWPNNIKNIEIYYKVVSYANDTKNDFLLSEYAKKILNTEKKYKIYTYSPKVDFLYIDSLKRLSKIKEAKKIAEDLIKESLGNKDKSRTLYELGELSYKLKEIKKAKKYFIKCSKIKTDNSWKELCKNSLMLF